MTEPDAPHLPLPAPIEAYGNGGFRFGGMSHRGGLLCFPDGIWSWPYTRVEDIDLAALRAALRRAQDLDFFILGTGATLWRLPQPLLDRFADVGLSIDSMQTGAAVRTYNILLGERRRAGAALLPVN